MFEEQIAEGREMIRLLEGELMLSPAERHIHRAHPRVPVRESGRWQETVEDKIRSAFGPEGLARYKSAWGLYQEELDRGEGDPHTRALNVYNRIIACLEEFDSRREGS